MDKYLPIGNAAWKSVEDYYNSHRPEGRPERDLDSLRKKYKDLHERKPPTGDPNIPEEVLEAKRIEEKIIENSQAFAAQSIQPGNEELEVEAIFEDVEDDEEVEIVEVEEDKKPRGRPRNSKNQEKQQISATEFLQYMMMNDKKEARRERECERREARRERARERREAQRSRRNMHLLAGILGAGINTFAPNRMDQIDVTAITTLLDKDKSEEEKTSDSDTLSTIHSDDSTPYKEAKQKQLEKRKRKRGAEL